MCGGTPSFHISSGSCEGLSPRVRGNQTRSMLVWNLPRSIPACAGEPLLATPAAVEMGVYPRVCGGTCEM